MIYLLFFIVVLCILFLVVTARKRFNRHQHNVVKSERILQKINSFQYAGQKLNYLRKIDPFVFEELLLSAYQKRDYSIVRNLKYTGDGGIDGLVYDKEGNEILIQAKRYSSYVNPKHLDDFLNLVNSSSAIKGKFIHTGKTGKQTYSTYKNSNIEIISGSNLLQLLNTN